MVKAYPHRARDRVGGSPMHTSPLCVIPGEYVWPMAKPYWPFQPAVSTPHSYGKMVPSTKPYGKNILPRVPTTAPHSRRCVCVCVPPGRTLASGIVHRCDQWVAISSTVLPFGIDTMPARLAAVNLYRISLPPRHRTPGARWRGGKEIL